MSQAHAQQRSGPLDSRELLYSLEAAIESERIAEDNRQCGEPSSPMFHFCRVLRGCETFAYRDEMAALQLVTKILQMRNPRARDAWAEEFDYDDPKASFVRNWNVVEFPAGIFDRALALAKANPLDVPNCFSEKYRRFLSLCASLQRILGEAPIIVSVTKFGEALHVTPMTISTYRKLAIESGLLVQVEDAVPRVRAARFRFAIPPAQKLNLVADFKDGNDGKER